MKTSDFDYHLPAELIAQHPVEPRDDSRLLVLDRASGRIEHSVFRRLGEYLKAGDLLTLNDTLVIRGRLRAKRKGTGGRVEFLLLRRLSAGIWQGWAGQAEDCDLASDMRWMTQTWSGCGGAGERRGRHVDVGSLG